VPENSVLTSRKLLAEQSGRGNNNKTAIVNGNKTALPDKEQRCHLVSKAGVAV